MKNSLLFVVINDYIKNKVNYNSNISFGKGKVINYLLENINFKEIKVKRIFVSTKDQEKILKKRGYFYNNFINFKKIDFHFCYSNRINSKFFIKGYSGDITKEKFFFNNSKNNIVITNSNYLKNFNNIPFEIISSLKKIIIEYIKNVLKILVKKSLLNRYNYITTLNLSINHNKILFFNEKIKKISGVLESGLYIKKKNTIYLYLNDINVFLN
ncbi:ribose-5-phosphate isomerase A [Candidatus Vidania fulgoroideorum]